MRPARDRPPVPRPRRPSGHLAYNRNNPVGGGCYDEDVPLTPLGRRIVEAVFAEGC
jgi:hypothetical protein